MTSPSFPPAGAAPKPLLDTIAKVRVAVADGDAGKLAALAPRDVLFDVVAPSAGPDLVWDASARVMAAGTSTIAYNVDRDDVTAVVDRTGVVRELRRMAAARAQAIRLAAGNSAQRKGERVEVEIAGLAGRALILLDIAGDGTVQALYPLGSDERLLKTDVYRLPIQMREPFGTDVLVAISAGTGMDVLEQGLRQLSNHRSVGPLFELIRTSLPGDARLGLLTLETVP